MTQQTLTAKDVAAVDRFVAVARQYCSVMEGAHAASGPQLIRKSAELLPELYRAALDLPDIETGTTDGETALRMAAKEDAHIVQASLPNELADYSIYWHTFDPLESPPDEPVASDLRNDFVEIYEDVRTGIQTWAAASIEDKADIAWGWRFNFIHHWGRHAVSAMTAVHALLFARFIELPRDD